VFFDVILNFYYCQRNLWPRFRSMLKPGGVLIMETLTIETLRVRPDYSPDYLLQPDELRRAFAEWEVLVYREGWVELKDHSPRAVQVCGASPSTSILSGAQSKDAARGQLPGSVTLGLFPGDVVHYTLALRSRIIN